VSQGDWFMHISSYQMHNVLNVYSKQLSQNRNVDKLRFEFKKTLEDHIRLSPEGKRKATIDKVAKEIVDNIGRLGTNPQKETLETNYALNNWKEATEKEKTAENEFVFNTIDKVNTKKTARLSVEDTNFLMKRLEQLAMDAIDNNRKGSK
jgi:hypothetical protein